MTITRNWVTWDWQNDPDAPREWEPDKTVVLVKKQGALGKGATALGEMADRAMLRLTERGGVGVIAYDFKDLRPRTHDVFPDRIIPALCIERQKDLTEPAIRTICCIQACHRAIVVTPREAIAIGLLGVLPQAWGIGYKCLHEFVELVIVRGPVGREAWPMHPRWVEKLRDECKEADVAFAFVGWGEWGPRTAAIRDVDPDGRLGEARHATDDMGEDVIMQRFGAKQSGRLLDGQEYIAVPDRLDPEPEDEEPEPEPQNERDPRTLDNPRPAPRQVWRSDRLGVTRTVEQVGAQHGFLTFVEKEPPVASASIESLVSEWVYVGMAEELNAVSDNPHRGRVVTALQTLAYDLAKGGAAPSEGRAHYIAEDRKEAVAALTAFGATADADRVANGTGGTEEAQALLALLLALNKPT